MFVGGCVALWPWSTNKTALTDDATDGICEPTADSIGYSSYVEQALLDEGDYGECYLNAQHLNKHIHVWEQFEPFGLMDSISNFYPPFGEMDWLAEAHCLDAQQYFYSLAKKLFAKATPAKWYSTDRGP